MNMKLRTIEVDAKTADALEAQAAARGIGIAELLAEYAAADSVPAEFDGLRAEGRAPWAPELLAEDARRFADFEQTREGLRGAKLRPGWKAGARRTNFRPRSRVS